MPNINFGAILVIGLSIGLSLIILLESNEPQKRPGFIPRERMNDEIKVKSKTGYCFEKIYIEDHLGNMHEILFLNTGATNGGVALLELCVYGNRRGKENY